METCRTCLFLKVACVCATSANDNNPFDLGFIRLPFDAVLARPSAYHRLSMAYRPKGLSRRSVLDHLNHVFTEFEGIAIDEKGRCINVAEIDVDEIFRTDADPSERWLSDFLRAGMAMPKRVAQGRVVPRLKLLWLALAITNPAQAALVIR